MPDPIDILQRKLLKKTQREVAEEIGISQPYLSQIMKGEREVSTEVARLLGLERVVTYKRRK